MPSIVLLMRSRLRIRPRSFSMRIPSSSSYWRLILRRPASSFGSSSAGALGVPAALLTDPEEAAWPEARELDDPALRAARGTGPLAGRLAALLCRLRLLLCHGVRR